MTSLHLIRKNLGRKKTRTLLTVLSIMVAFILFTMLNALNRAYTLGLDLAGADRLITMHKVSFIQPMPLSYVNRIAAIDGVADVAHQTWFGAYYQEPRAQFGLFPTELETLPDVYPEYKVPEDQWQTLLQTRIGLMVGQAMMDANGWELGQQLPLGSTIYPQQDGSYFWDFQIVAVFQGVGDGSDEQQAYAHYDYFNESRRFGRDSVGWIITRVSDSDQAESIAEQIDTRFANSSTQTKTSSEKGWIAGFAAQFGNIGLIVRIILGCVFFALLLVAGNTMAQAVRERTNELAVMKTLGFENGKIVRLVLGESLTVAVLGGVLGLLLGWLLVSGASVAMAQFLPGLAVSSSTWLTGLVLSVLLGLITGAIPAMKAMRLNVVEALARR